jgi:hypothetical protein
MTGTVTVAGQQQRRRKRRNFQTFIMMEKPAIIIIVQSQSPLVLVLCAFETIRENSVYLPATAAGKQTNLSTLREVCNCAHAVPGVHSCTDFIFVQRQSYPGELTGGCSCQFVVCFWCAPRTGSLADAK